MIKKLSILAALSGLCILAFAADPKPGCSACKQEIKVGEYLAGVQAKKGIGHIHFKCALKRHLRYLPKK